MLKEKMNSCDRKLPHIDWKKSAICGGCGFALAMALCMLFSWLLCKGAIGEDMAGVFAYFALFAGGMLAAYLAAGKTRTLPTALPAAAVVLGLLFLCGVLFFGGMKLSALLCAALVLLAAAMAGSALSASIK